MSQIVRDQLTDSLAALTQHDIRSAEAVVERDDVVDSLNRSLEERCFGMFRGASGVVEERRIRSAMRVITNLERIGDAACHIAKHCLMLAREDEYELPIEFDDLAKIALLGLEESVQSFLKSDLDLAKQACEREVELDQLYVQKLEDIARRIDASQVHGHPILHALAVMKYLEKVCDFVLNIGETTVYAHTGSRLTYPQFKQLELLMPAGGEPMNVFRHYWDGISGATVIEMRRGDAERVLFKESYGQKVQDEFDKTIEWEGIAPNHTARVIAITHARGRTGILREFVEGSLMLDLLLSEAHPEVKEAVMRKVADVLTEVWTTTITPVPPKIEYIQQLRARLREILRRHPRLEKVAKEQLEGYGGLFDLLTHLEPRQAWLAPPFSIWVHGDLNANNVVVDQATNGVVFIDVHRSQYGDYLQDVAVLCTSALRRFPRGKAAKGIARANEVLLEVAEEFGRKNGDRNFAVRLRLARARALITSARLENDPERAERLFVDGLDLLKKVAKALKVGRVA
jgi:phosphate uptake regulator/aminoglycoside phosphotransferase (APT) family kinase protein